MNEVVIYCDEWLPRGSFRPMPGEQGKWLFGGSPEDLRSLMGDQMTCPRCHKLCIRDKHEDVFVCTCGWRSR